MNKNTISFLENVEKGKPVREAISSEVHESRFHFYTHNMNIDSEMLKLANNSEETALSEYILSHQTVLGLKVRLTKRGARRLAQQLVLKYRGV